jgi:LacI family transcriptional regulator
MAEIGYVYNRAAANLRSASVGLVGLVINDLRNPFFTEFATSLQMTLAAQGYATVIANSDEDPALQAKLVASMIEHGVAALVISPAYGEAGDTFDGLARTGLPVCQVLRKGDERTELFPFASFDYAAGSAAATRHLMEQGARRIAFVGGLPGRAITRERKSGWREVLKAEGVEEIALHGKSSRAFGMQAAEVLLAEHPDVDAAHEIIIGHLERLVAGVGAPVVEVLAVEANRPRTSVMPAKDQARSDARMLPDTFLDVFDANTDDTNLDRILNNSKNLRLRQER